VYIYKPPVRVFNGLSFIIKKGEINMKFNKLIPELTVTNIDKSKEFYENLGFKIMYERKENKFCFLELFQNQIMIEEINENWNTGKLEYPFGRGINISMEITNVEEMKENAIKHHYPLFMDIKESKYRVDNKLYVDKELLIQDPDGYLLRFTESKTVKKYNIK